MFILLMTPVVLLIPFGPFTRWGQDEALRVARPLLGSAIFAVVGGLLIAWWLDAFNLRAIAGWMGGLWLMAGSLAYVARQKSWRLPRHQMGMILAHAGVGVFVIGVAMVESTTFERDVRFAPGQTMEVAGYTFELHEIASVKGPNWIADEARFSVYKNDRFITHMAPQKRRYHRSGQVMTQVALRPGLFRDLYVAMGEPLRDDVGAWSIRVHIKPFIRWIWLGALMLAFGALISASDRRYWVAARREREAQAPAHGALTRPRRPPPNASFTAAIAGVSRIGWITDGQPRHRRAASACGLAADWPTHAQLYLAGLA